MSMKLYGVAISGNVNPILGLCLENGIPYELVVTNPMEGATKTDDFRRLNPMHCIPTMDDEGFTM
jgi:glutathione S-transferase